MTFDHAVRTPATPAPDTSRHDAPDSAPDASVAVRANPGRGPAVQQQLIAAVTALGELPDVTHQLTDGALTEMVATLTAIRARAEHALTLATADAADRGTIHASPSASPTAWIIDQAAESGHPIEPRDAHTMAVVADACRQRRNTVIRRALHDGTCTLPAARTALTQSDRIAPVLPASTRDEVLAWYLSLDPALGTRAQHQLTRRILARYAPEHLDHDDTRLEEAETLTWSEIPGGLTRLVAHLAPSSAATLKEAITALSAPRPAGSAAEVPSVEFGAGHALSGSGASARPQDACATESAGSSAAGSSADQSSAAESSTEVLVPDTRTPAKRRLDALLDLVAAGARAHTGTDAGWVGKPAATITVTMALQTLTTGLDGAITTSGDILDASTARRLACDADLIPAVLGGPSEPLDVGRRQRLATKGLRAAVTLRDRGCTFPGCDRPPGFCEIHHLRPWWTGGPTNLTNSAMLCTTHHRTVHRHGYTGTLIPHHHGPTVSWDLSPGQLPSPIRGTGGVA